MPFTETRTFAISKNPLRQTGTLRTGKDLGLSLSYEGSAKPHVIVVDDKGLIDRQPGGRERQVTVADHPELAALTDLYLNLLRGNADKLFDYADVYFTGTRADVGNGPRPARRHAWPSARARSSSAAAGTTSRAWKTCFPTARTRTLDLGKVERNPKFTAGGDPDVFPGRAEQAV